MKKNTYQFRDREFHSIKELSQYTGVNEKTLVARIRRGMSVTEACEKKDLRCTYYSVNNELKSIKMICKEQIKNPDLIRNRLRYGYSLVDALNTPKKISRQVIPIVVHGVLYNSIAEALRKLNLTDKEQRVRRRLKKGIPPNDAFSFEE